MALEGRSQPPPRPVRRLVLPGMCAWVNGTTLKLIVPVLLQPISQLWQIVAIVLMGGGSLLILAGLAALARASIRVRWRIARQTSASSWWWLVLLAVAYLCLAVAFMMSSLSFILAPALVGWIMSTLFISIATGTVLFVIANIPWLRFFWHLMRAAR